MISPHGLFYFLLKRNIISLLYLKAGRQKQAEVKPSNPRPPTIPKAASAGEAQDSIKFCVPAEAGLGAGGRGAG